MTLFEAVKKYGKIRGMNVKEVALKAGLSENAIYGWKKHTPAKATIELVARELGVSPKTLTGEDDTKEPTKIDLKASIDDDDIIMTYDGKPIPKEDLDLIKRLMRGEQMDNSILFELQSKAAHDGITIIWTDGLHPSTPPVVSVKRKKIIMNLNWPNQNEQTFQLGHEMSHIYHNDPETCLLYYSNKYTKSDIENDANLGSVDLILPYYMNDRSTSMVNPVNFIEAFSIPDYLFNSVENKIKNLIKVND